MAALRLLFVSVLFDFATTDICCSPFQWESDNMIWESKTEKGITDFTQRVEHMYTDNASHKIAFKANITSGGNTTSVHIIQDYPVGTQYRIYGNPPNLCLRDVLGPWLSTCIPDNGTLVSSGYTGQTDRVTVDTYRMTYAVAPDLTYFISVARPDCVPTEAHVYGKIANVPRQISKTYKNFSVGIKDKYIFDVPVFCNH